MPELPDLTLYQEALTARVVGSKWLALRLANPFLLRTVEPKPAELVGQVVVGIEPRSISSRARSSSQKRQ